MTGVWDGIKVLDLSSGIAGPIVGMLLADNGADVIKVEPPGGDPFRVLSGYRVWNRGKRSAIFDLRNPGDRDLFLALVERTDVLLESFSPGTTARLDIDYDSLRRRNSELVYCSISGYGADDQDAGRPGYDALVAARTGHQWESRGVLGGTTARLSRTRPIMAGFEVPYERWQGPPRDGPMFEGVPWPSIGAAHLAHLGITSALYAREVMGRGQHVETSLLMGALASAIGWVRAEHADAPGFETWLSDPRGFKGHYICSDGRWVHMWGQTLGLLAAAQGEELVVTPEVKANLGARPIGSLGTDLPDLQGAIEEFQQTFKRFPASEWDRAATEADLSAQTVRSPEEALTDPLLISDGCVTEIHDPEVGPIRQAGRLWRMQKCDWNVRGPAPTAGQHNNEVRSEASISDLTRAPRSAQQAPRSLAHPLDGIRVIDLSIAAAGPFGAQLLAELGADVIKVKATDGSWLLPESLHVICERSKRSIAIDLKDPEGMAVFRRLLKTADVVVNNMREAAVDRLGLGYEALRAVNPNVIYCHTRAHEDGPRKNLLGHDQSAACIAGVEWIEGGLDDGGRPHWPMVSVGDLGNGFLLAAVVVQALYHRHRTGEGQKVDTSIVNAHLLNASMAWTTPDGAVCVRPKLDRMAMGWSALYRLYQCVDGWICIAAFSDDHWTALCDAIDSPQLARDTRFATAQLRRENDKQLVELLETAFGGEPVAAVHQKLDEHGVPAEISSPDYILRFFEDPTNFEKHRLTTFEQPIGGRTTTTGLLVDLSETPGKLWGPAFVPGDYTREIMQELGYSNDEIDKACAQGSVAERPR